MKRTGLRPPLIARYVSQTDRWNLGVRISVDSVERFVRGIRAGTGAWAIYAARFSSPEPRGRLPQEVKLEERSRKPIPWDALMRLCRRGERWTFRWVAAHRRGHARFIQAPGWRVL